ncbi:alkaline shock response membrane anchor protein AmaP [Streptomyces sp. NPDC057638]|uniref:alkaline shock response membrane anchor protein AmaP n=1 Tax=Streptomyces sp. NPDC057638 TaxID=3346190 RepID=UPI0036B8132A
MSRTVNRVVLGVTGLALLAVGGAALAAGAGLAVPGWWPWRGPHDVLLSMADRQRWRAEGWWWPAVIAALAVLVLLALWLLLAQSRRGRLADVLVDSGDGEVAVVRGRSLEGAMEADTEALDGVAEARVTLGGRRTEPKARVGVVLEPYASPVRTLAAVREGVVGRAREVVGVSVLPTEARLRAAKHPPQRVT